MPTETFISLSPAIAFVALLVLALVASTYDTTAPAPIKVLAVAVVIPTTSAAAFFSLLISETWAPTGWWMALVRFGLVGLLLWACKKKFDGKIISDWMLVPTAAVALMGFMAGFWSLLLSIAS